MATTMASFTAERVRCALMVVLWKNQRTGWVNCIIRWNTKFYYDRSLVITLLSGGSSSVLQASILAHNPPIL
ncbi:MAG: hypothetical protein A2W35_19245 [Chloroflexi bacterium RBG_16_57_11]|nr:MAG: hypothetical protein A2W35_19245 [Chloroflexi bacterium RBG_16_57_11]